MKKLLVSSGDLNLISGSTSSVDISAGSTVGSMTIKGASLALQIYAAGWQNKLTISSSGLIDPIGGFGTTTNGAASATTSGLVTTGTQTFAGTKTFSDTATGTKIAKFTSDTATASATDVGIITTGTQTIAGTKTFSSKITGSISGNCDGSAGSCTGNAGSVTNGVYTTGTQSIAGAKTFSDTATGTKIAKFTSDTAAASATDVGIITTGAQTLAGVKTFSSPISSAGAKVLAPWTTGTVYPIGSYVSYTVNTNQTYALVCQAAHTSGTYATDVGLGYWQMATPMKNWLINGGFDFSQRGQTITAPATAAFVSDRWRNSLDSSAPAGGYTQVIAVGSPYPVRSRYWLLTVSPASGATGYRGIYQILETNRLLENTQVSVSFWVYATTSTTINVRWVDGTNRNGATYRSASQAVTGAVGTKITVTFSGFQTDVNSLMWIYWPDTNSQNVYIADVMLNEGTAPAAFQLAGESIGGELALCQRYYEKSYSPDVTPGTVTTAGAVMFRGTTDNGPNIGGPIFYKVTKRYATTNISFWNASTGAANTWQAAQAAGTTTPTMNYQMESMSSILVFGTVSTNWAAGYIYGHWAVDAEI